MGLLMRVPMVETRENAALRSRQQVCSAPKGLEKEIQGLSTSHGSLHPQQGLFFQFQNLEILFSAPLHLTNLEML